MKSDWNDQQPIYLQLRDRIVALILDGVIKEDEPLPSVRTVAADYRINPLTVLKAFQTLTEEQLIEKRRGIGMFIRPGAPAILFRERRARFLSHEWPTILATIRRLDLSPEDLLRKAEGQSAERNRVTTKKGRGDNQ